MEHGPRGAGRGFGGLTRIFEGEHGLNGWNGYGRVFFKRNLPGGRWVLICLLQINFIFFDNVSKTFM